MEVAGEDSGPMTGCELAVAGKSPIWCCGGRKWSLKQWSSEDDGDSVTICLVEEIELDEGRKMVLVDDQDGDGKMVQIVSLMDVEDWCYRRIVSRSSVHKEEK
ncbi:hypothetical protein A2U01_0000270, partial [Trifolium medium]|nr:hypothetical protein [Trifolium medium]